VNLELYESYEIIEKILSFGASVKVLSPSSLAQKIKGITQEVYGMY
jgi:predicted DNA-binding transcriptional regulator YafY